MVRIVSAFITRSRRSVSRICGGRDDADAGKKIRADVKNLIDFATPGQVAAFIAEINSKASAVGVVFPDNYSSTPYETCPRGRRGLHPR